MAQIVANGRIEADNWRLLDTPAAVAALDNAGSTHARVLVPLALWLEERIALLATQHELGVLLEGTEDPARLAGDIDRLALIAVRIPRFADGRSYSVARLLRGRYRYQGELRAVGDVLHDQLFYLMRVGFDAFALRADQDPHAAQAALEAFSAPYQGSSDQPPLFRRRQAA
jgi:uncharacterized protein (DUF934 family)